jgi:hypothetical protein
VGEVREKSARGEGDVSEEKLNCALILSDYTVVTECSIPNNLKKD